MVELLAREEIIDVRIGEVLGRVLPWLRLSLLKPALGVALCAARTLLEVAGIPVPGHRTL